MNNFFVKPSLSIIIPTYNRESILCATLDALLGLSDQFTELIVVDQTPTHRPETSTFLHNLPDKCRIINMSSPNLPRARNIGAKAACGHIILYLDDDIKPLPDLLPAHTRHYTDGAVGGVAGKLLSPNGEVKKLDPRYYNSPLPWRYIRFDQDWQVREVESAPGGNMSFRRKLILQSGGFDDNFVGNAFREETDFCIRLRKQSYRILFDPAAALVHYWKTEGGCDHTRFANPKHISFSYYIDFIQNNFYFFLKHAPRTALIELLWELYRNHIGNRENLHQGYKHLYRRHLAFFLGISRAFKVWYLQQKKPHRNDFL